MATILVHLATVSGVLTLQVLTALTTAVTLQAVLVLVPSVALRLLVLVSVAWLLSHAVKRTTTVIKTVLVLQ